MDMNDAWARELPLTHLPAIPHWSENYAWNAYDPVSRISLFLSIGRWHLDPTLWREFIGVCVGDTVTYSRRNIGRLADPRLVGASCLRIECLQPSQRWHLRYHGPAQKGSGEQLLHGAPEDNVCSLLDFDLQWDAGDTPLIDFGHGTEGADSADGMSSHIEQGGTCKGHFSIDGVHYDFNTRSMRDHSRGPRQHKVSFGRHSWINGQFPSGRTIASLTLERPDKSMAMASLFVAEKSGADGYPVGKYQFDRTLLHDRFEDVQRPYTLLATNDQGKKIRIEAEPIVSYPLSIAHPSDVYIGQSNHFGGWRIFEMATRLRWDGEETYGWTEISLTPQKSRQFAER